MNRIEELREKRDAWYAVHGDERDWPGAIELDELESADRCEFCGVVVLAGDNCCQDCSGEGGAA